MSRALHAGIGVVYQERNLIPAFSIAENIVLHHLPQSAGVVDRKRMRAEAVRCLKLLEVDLDPDTPIARLSVAQAAPVGGFTGWKPAMPVTIWSGTR